LSDRLEELPEKDRLILVVEGDQLIGYAQLRVVFDPIHGPIAEVAAILVQPDRRREGFGQRLIAAAETWARQSNRSHLLLSSDVVRTSGHAFFTALGYEQNATNLEFIRTLVP
jgi:GNAT superfamily N-acetyltransferase